MACRKMFFLLFSLRLSLTRTRLLTKAARGFMCRTQSKADSVGESDNDNKNYIPLVRIVSFCASVLYLVSTMRATKNKQTKKQSQSKLESNPKYPIVSVNAFSLQYTQSLDSFSDYKRHLKNFFFNKGLHMMCNCTKEKKTTKQNSGIIKSPNTLYTL